MIKRIREKHVWYYWLTYMVLLALTVFLVSRKWNDALFIMLFCWLAVIVIGAVEQSRLRAYLKIHHNGTWAHVTSSSFFKPGGSNSFRFLPFLYSRDHHKDARLEDLKSTNRHVIVLTVLVFISFMILGIVVTALWWQ